MSTHQTPEKKAPVPLGHNIISQLESEVENKIVVIRNQEVIADADVAALYGVTTQRVNEAVKNNPEKFLHNYMFELTDSELLHLLS